MTTSGSEHFQERDHPRKGRVILLATLLAVLLAGALVAQSNQGSMSGTVLDSSGAVVPDVKSRTERVSKRIGASMYARFPFSSSSFPCFIRSGSAV